MSTMKRNDLDQVRNLDGSITNIPVVRWAYDVWEPLQIKALFTPEEWAAAKTVATDTWENMAFTFHAIPAETIVGHLRLLVPAVLTEARFTEITGEAY